MKYSEFAEEWKKVIASTKRFIKGAEKRGYKFDWQEPELPEHVSPKKLRELKWSTQRQKLYQRAEYTAPSGEILSGYQGQTFERKRSAKKGQETRRKKEFQKRAQEAPRISSTIYKNLRDSLVELSTTEYKGARRNLRWADVMYAKKENAQSLLSLLDSKIAQVGEYELFSRLEEKAPEIQGYLSNLYLASTQEQVNSSAVALATLINGETLTVQESANYTDFAEQLQGLDLV